MIKTISRFLIAICLAFSLTMVKPEKSEALVVFTNYPLDASIGMKIFGIFICSSVLSANLFGFYYFPYLLGVCALNNESTQNIKNISPQYLSENGYNDEEVSELMSQQDLFLRSLEEKQAVILIQNGDTSETFKKEMLSVQPQLSDEYVMLVTQYFGL